jgi:hypothetical protein
LTAWLPASISRSIWCSLWCAATTPPSQSMSPAAKDSSSAVHS